MLRFNKSGKYIAKYGFKSIYIRMYIIFVAILLIILLAIWGFSYYYMSNIIRDKVNKTSMQTLELIQGGTDSQFDKVRTLISYISLQNIVVSDYSTLNIGEKYYLTFDFIKQYKVEEFVESMGIYYYKSNIALKFGENATSVKYSNDMNWIAPYTDASALGLNVSVINRKLEEIEQIPIVTMVKGYPMFSAEKTGAIFVNVDRNKLFSTVSGNSNIDSSFLIVDNENGLVYGDQKLYDNISQYENFINKNYKIIRIDGKKYVVSYLKSDSTNWSYYRVIDENTLLKEAATFGYILFLIILIFTFVGIFLWKPFAKKIYNPLIGVLDKFKGSIQDGDEQYTSNEFDLLNKLISNIVLQRDVAESIFKRSSAEFTKGIFFNLINGTIEDWDVIKKEMLAIGFEYDNGVFVALNLKLEDFSKEIKDLQFERVLEDFMKENSLYKRYLYTDIDTNSYIILLNIKHSSAEKYEIAVNLMNYLRCHYECSVTIGLGRMYDTINECSKSITEAVNALKYKTFIGKGAIIDINSLPEDKRVDNKYFNISKAVQFIESIKMGDLATSVEIVNSIMDNIEPTVEAIDYVSDILWQMINSIMIALHDLNLKFEDVFDVSEFECYKRFTRFEEVEHMKNYIMNLLEGILQYSKEKSTTINEEIASKMKDYVDVHYNEEIMLNDIADNMHLSISYASSLFKLHTGKNFIDYLRSIRMDRAIAMLKTSKKSVNEIAEKVGYTNTRSFLRIFKNYTSMTPTEYRKTYVVRSNSIED